MNKIWMDRIDRGMTLFGVIVIELAIIYFGWQIFFR